MEVMMKRKNKVMMKRKKRVKSVGEIVERIDRILALPAA